MTIRKLSWHHGLTIRLHPWPQKQKKAFSFSNNHVRAQAPKNAREMAVMLKDQGYAVNAG